MTAQVQGNPSTTPNFNYPQKPESLKDFQHKLLQTTVFVVQAVHQNAFLGNDNSVPKKVSKTVKQVDMTEFHTKKVYPKFFDVTKALNFCKGNQELSKKGIQHPEEFKAIIYTHALFIKFVFNLNGYLSEFLSSPGNMDKMLDAAKAVKDVTLALEDTLDAEHLIDSEIIRRSIYIAFKQLYNEFSSHRKEWFYRMPGDLRTNDEFHPWWRPGVPMQYLKTTSENHKKGL